MSLLQPKMILPALALSFALAGCGGKKEEATAPSSKALSFPLQGVVIKAMAHTNTPGMPMREIDVDCGKLVDARSAKNAKGMSPTVSFISHFDQTNTPEYMAQLSPVNRSIIERSRDNLTINATETSYMITHVHHAHGVQYKDIEDAVNSCRAHWSPA